MALPNSLESPIGELFNTTSQPNSIWVPLSNINITDTNVHSYLTDPPSAQGTGIAIVKLGNILGSGESTLRTYSLFIYNNENQTLSVQPITNVVNDGSLNDMNLISAYSVNSGVDNIQSFSFDVYPVEYISVLLSFATAPTSAPNTAIPQGVYAILFLYYG